MGIFSGRRSAVAKQPTGFTSVWVTAAVIIVLVIAALSFSSAFQECVKKGTADTSSSNQQEEQALPALLFNCGVSTVEKHHNLVVAVATVVIAIFTVILGLATHILSRETKRLRSLADKQRGDMRDSLLFAADSVREAQRSADAAFETLRTMRKTATQQAADMKESLRIANISARAAHLSAERLFRVDRPWLVMEAIDVEGFVAEDDDPLWFLRGDGIEGMHGDVTFRINPKLRNVGTRLGMMLETQFRIVDSLTNPADTATVKRPSRPSDLDALTTGDIIVPNEVRNWPHSEVSVNCKWLRFAFGTESELIIHGYIRYRDIHKIVRRSGFCFLLVSRFHLPEGCEFVKWNMSQWYDEEEKPEQG